MATRGPSTNQSSNGWGDLMDDGDDKGSTTSDKHQPQATATHHRAIDQSRQKKLQSSQTKAKPHQASAQLRQTKSPTKQSKPKSDSGSIKKSRQGAQQVTSNTRGHNPQLPQRIYDDNFKLPKTKLISDTTKHAITSGAQPAFSNINSSVVNNLVSELKQQHYLLKIAVALQEHLISTQDPREDHRPFCIIYGPNLRKILQGESNYQNLCIATNNQDFSSLYPKIITALQTKFNTPITITKVNDTSFQIYIPKTQQSILLSIGPKTHNIQSVFNYLDFSFNGFVLNLTTKKNHRLYFCPRAIQDLNLRNFYGINYPLERMFSHNVEHIFSYFRYASEFGLQNLATKDVRAIHNSVEHLSRIQYIELAKLFHQVFSDRNCHNMLQLMYQSDFFRYLPFPLGLKSQDQIEDNVIKLIFDNLPLDSNNIFSGVAFLLLPNILVSIKMFQQSYGSDITAAKINEFCENAIDEFLRNYGKAEYQNPQHAKQAFGQAVGISLRHYLLLYLQQHDVELYQMLTTTPVQPQPQAQDLTDQSHQLQQSIDDLKAHIGNPEFSTTTTTTPETITATETAAATSTTMPATQADITSSAKGCNEQEKFHADTPLTYEQLKFLYEDLALAFKEPDVKMNKILQQQKLILATLKVLYEQNAAMQKAIVLNNHFLELNANLTQYVGATCCEPALPMPKNGQALTAHFDKLRLDDQQQQQQDQQQQQESRNPPNERGLNPSASPFNP